MGYVGPTKTTCYFLSDDVLNSDLTEESVNGTWVEVKTFELTAKISPLSTLRVKFDLKNDTAGKTARARVTTPAGTYADLTVTGTTYTTKTQDCAATTWAVGSQIKVEFRSNVVPGADKAYLKNCYLCGTLGDFKVA